MWVAGDGGVEQPPGGRLSPTTDRWRTVVSPPWRDNGIKTEVIQRLVDSVGVPPTAQLCGDLEIVGIGEIAFVRACLRNSWPKYGITSVVLRTLNSMSSWDAATRLGAAGPGRYSTLAFSPYRTSRAPERSGRTAANSPAPGPRSGPRSCSTAARLDHRASVPVTVRNITGHAESGAP